MKWSLSLAIVLLAIVATAVPFSSAATVESVQIEDVNLMLMESEVTINSTDEHTINVNIYNGGPKPVAVRLWYDSKDIVLTMDHDVIVDNGKTYVLEVKIVPNDYLKEGDYYVPINVQIFASDAEHEGILPLTINLLSVYSSNSYYNTVMGIYTLPEPYDEEWISLIVTIVAWILVSIVACLLCVLVVSIFFNSKDGRKTEKSSMIYFFCLMMTFAVTNTVRVAGLDEELVANIDRIAALAKIMFGAIVVWDVYKGIVYHVLHKVDENSDVEGSSAIPIMNLLGQVVITGVAVAAILSHLGVDLVGIIAGAGIASLGVSLGAKPIINEFFSGLVLLITRPFVKGDRIRIGSDTSALQVMKVKIMLTELSTAYTNEVITMPNSKISSSPITNVTWSSERYRHTVKFRVEYGSDIELAKELIRQAACEDPGVLTGDPELHDPVVIVSNTNEHGNVILTLAFYSKVYSNTWDCTGLIYEGVLRKFAQHGVRIPPYQKRLNIISGGETDAQ